MAILRSRSRIARRREWRSQTRLRAAVEGRLRRSVAGELRRTGRDAAAAYEAGDGLDGAMLAIEGHEARIREILTPHYRRTMLAFGERLIDAARAGGLLEVKQEEAERQTFLSLMQAWIQRVGGQKVKRIAETTRKQIQAAVLAGVEVGEGQAAVAKLIRRQTEGAIGRLRAEIIARTETHSAATTANQQVLEALNLPDVRQEWVAAEDERTRASHRSADGQVRNRDEPFDVGGSKLRYPGDPAGPAAEIINCRCVAAAVVDD